MRSGLSLFWLIRFVRVIGAIVLVMTRTFIWSMNFMVYFCSGVLFSVHLAHYNGKRSSSDLAKVIGCLK